MKKQSFSTLLFILFLVGIAAFAVCGIMLDWFTTQDTVIAPTCTEQGYTLHQGWFHRESKKDMTAPLGHRYDIAVTDPTCLTGGSSQYTCLDCGHSYVGSPTEATGHRYTQDVVHPTCEAGGYTVHLCSACGDSYRDSETAPRGHIYISVTVEPTCDKPGYTEYICNVCDHTYRDNESPALGHDNSTEVIPATCLTPGYTLTVCRRCAAAELINPEDALGHNYLAYITTPTCTTAGYTTYMCTNCRDSYTEDYVEARGHDYTVTKLTATTTHAGGTVHNCARCDDTHMTDVYTFAEVFDGRQGDGRGILAEGVDLSHHNGEVDFEALKAAGISFVILRVGTSNTPDEWFETYYEQAREAGLDIGAYLYTYATTTRAATADAAWLLEKLKGKTFEYPIFYDMEDKSMTALSKNALTDIAITFCETMVNAGYYPGIYTNKTWITNHLDVDRIRANYDIWLASWIVTGDNISDYSDDFSLWQYTATGKVAGVSTDVDRNGVYRDFPTYIKKYGYNGFGAQ